MNLINSESRGTWGAHLTSESETIFREPNHHLHPFQDLGVPFSTCVELVLRCHNKKEKRFRGSNTTT